MDKRILILDDDPIFRRSVAEEVGALGMAAELAASGSEADKKIQKQSFGLIIVDGLLPDTTGMNWIQKYRKEGGRALVIFASAFFKDLNTFHLLTEELGVCQVFSKPVDPEVLAKYAHAILPDQGSVVSAVAHVPEFESRWDVTQASHLESVRTTQF